jgi:hypothetical protein
MVTYKPKGQGGGGREDSGSQEDFQARIERMKARLGAS